jgi:tetratricopeptide (TPR) repeat protein
VPLASPVSVPPSRRNLSIPRAPRRHANSPLAHEVRALIAQRLKMLEQGVDHFQLLGVAQDTPADDVRKAYFALARQLHPDRLAALDIDDESREAQRLFAHVNTAFAVLSDRRRRDEYASILRRGGEAVVRAEQAQAEAMAMRIIESEDAFTRGEAALRREQLGLAISELSRAVELNPGEADYQATLAWAQFCNAHDKQVVAVAIRTTLERAIEASPKAIRARFYLGRVERMVGRDAEALRHFQDVLRRAPSHQEASAEVRVLEQRLASPPLRRR